MVDTPGFNDTEIEDEDIYYKIIDWLKDFHEKGQKLSGLIYLHPINKTREKGSDVQSLKVFKRLVGSENYTKIVIGLTFYDIEDPETTASRERELRESPDMWADMIAAGATVTRIPFDKDECISLIAKMACKETMTLQAERELFEQNKSAAELSAMKEMQDQEELRIMRLKEEMEQTTQQMIFDEQIRLTSEFSAERAKLAQQLFEERQAMQVLEQEILLLKDACEREKEDGRALKLQHSREEELWKQKVDQEKQEVEAEKENAMNAFVQMKIEEVEDVSHAIKQIGKIQDYITSKGMVFGKYLDAAKELKSRPQSINDIRLAKNRGCFFSGWPCYVCWLPLQIDEPMPSRSNPSYPRLL